jgi:aminoglycoside 6'-N-acetyltransferase I
MITKNITLPNNVKPRIVIKNFDPDYKQDFIRLFVKTFTQAPWFEQWTEKKAAAIFHRIIKKTYSGYTAFRKDIPVGFIVGYSLGDFFPLNKLFYLDQLFIDSENQNSGVGGSIIERLIDELKAKKIKLIILLTKNKSVAQKFYQKRGFKKIISIIQIKEIIIMYRILS